MHKHIILRNLSFALLLGTGTAPAHDNSYFDTNPTPHGGQVRMVGAYHVEAVVENRKLLLYVTDHGDQPQSTAGWRGRATIVNGTEISRLPLDAAGGNRLRGDAAVNVGADTKMAVILQPPDAETLELNYTPATAAGGVATAP